MFASVVGSFEAKRSEGSGLVEDLKALLLFCFCGASGFTCLERERERERETERERDRERETEREREKVCHLILHAC